MRWMTPAKLGGAIPSGREREPFALEARPCGRAWETETDFHSGPGGRWQLDVYPPITTAYRVRWNQHSSRTLTVRVRPIASAACPRPTPRCWPRASNAPFPRRSPSTVCAGCRAAHRARPGRSTPRTRAGRPPRRPMPTRPSPPSPLPYQRQATSPRTTVWPRAWRSWTSALPVGRSRSPPQRPPGRMADRDRLRAGRPRCRAARRRAAGALPTALPVARRQPSEGFVRDSPSANPRMPTGPSPAEARRIPRRGCSGQPRRRRCGTAGTGRRDSWSTTAGVLRAGRRSRPRPGCATPT